MLNVRNDFPILSRKVQGKKLTYLDNAATTQKPQAVIDAELSYYREHNANIHRGLHTLSEEATELYEQSHHTASNFIGADFEEVVFTRNATESLNLVAYSWGLENLKKGDEVVLSKMEHHSQLVPWQQISHMKGATLRYIDLTKDGSLDINSAEKLIGSKTKVVAVTQMSNSLGTINDVTQLTKLAHDYHAISVIDGAQSVPHFPVNVKKLGCDFLAFSAHKMCGPTGIGVLYGKREHLESMKPFLYGGGMIREVSFESTRFNDLPWKFEAGTPNIAGAIGFDAALKYLTKIGMDTIFAHDQELLKKATKRLLEIKKLSIIGNSPKKGSIISFNVEGIPPHDMASLLDSEGVAIRAGHHCNMPLMNYLNMYGTSRASFYLYNTPEEIETLALAIEKAKKVFGV